MPQIPQMSQLKYK